MHVLHRPHLPRLITASILAASLAIVISLALASSLSNFSPSGNGTSVPAPHSAVAPTSPPRWASNPFPAPPRSAAPTGASRADTTPTATPSLTAHGGSALRVNLARKT
jgi:hypothetical protein